MRQRLLTSENRKWWTLAAVALGLFMIMLDNTTVNAAATTRNHVEPEAADELIDRLAA